MMRSRSSNRVWRRKERGAQGPASERGTVLLMVIGVLAMLAILAIVYASLGQSDRRSSSAYVRAAQVVDISGQIGDYIADIIGKDVSEPIVELLPAGRQREARVTWTYASMDYNNNVKSNPSIGGGTEFKPYGGGFQPWLAPIEPTFLRFSGTTPWTNQDRQYLDYRDWLQISNVAPNGQFVNLANLRNNFFAEPGIGNDSNNRPRMSVGLTLYGNNAAGLPQNANNPSLLDGTNANPNIPWHWTAWQRHAARPITNFRNDPNQANPGQNEFIQNQWADADGDGIADARWFELNTAVGPLAQWISQSLTQQDKARYFAAVRIVDLSGMTNISTAMDLLQEPTPLADAVQPAAYPLGITPSDTDLLRRLSIADAYQRYGVGYDFFQQPSNPQEAGFYGQYTNAGATPVARLVGRAAYANLQWSIATDRVADAATNDLRGLLGTVPSLSANPEQTFSTPFDIAPDQRARLYIESQLDPTNIGYSTNIFLYDTANPNNPPFFGFRSRQPFGMAEELELHAFFSANDPRESSRLEAVLDGRRNDSGDGAIYPTFGPLRAPRGHDVERDRRGIVSVNGQQDDTSLAQQHLDLRHTITTYNAARPLTYLRPQRSFDPNVLGDNEVRVNLTPFLNPRIAVSTDALRLLFNHAADAIMPYRNVEQGDNYWEPVYPQRALHYARNAEFAVRSAAHWTLNFRDSVDDDNAVHRVGGAPDDDVRGPSVMTLRTTQAASMSRTPQYPWDELTLENFETEAAAPGTVHSERVNIYGIEAQPILIEAASYGWWSDVRHNANVLPSQIQPDNEFLDSDPDGPGGPIPPQGNEPITIDHEVLYNNADFLGEVVAFQITNPFDRDITLTRAGASFPEIFYYVEYANRYFPLAEIDPNAAGFAIANVDLELRAGETRVFFATSPRREINFNARFQVATSRVVPPFSVTNFLRSWVNAQFRETGVVDQRDAIHTTMFDPESFALISPEPGAPDDDAGIMDLHGVFADPPASSDDRRVVKLWRVMRHRLDDAPNTPNLRSNDMLADRLRDPAPAEPTLFQRLDAGSDHEVPNTIAGDDTTPRIPPPDPEDNTGFTITMWGAIRRPTRPLDATYRFRGGMPPWAIEAREEDQAYSFSHTDPVRNPDPRSLNAVDSGPPDRGSGPDYRNSIRSQYISFRDMYNDQANGGGGSRINDQMRKKAETKTGNIIPVSQSLDADYPSGRPFETQAVRIALGGRDRSNEEWNSGLYRRMGDVLLPLAIGPYYDPNSRTGDDRMCLTEVLALASDYYSPGAQHIYYLAGHLDTTAGIRPKLDHGHFVIDDFVPFNDRDGNGAFNPSASNKEETLGLGIPIALNLLDKFRLDGIGGKAKGESGKTNINTATLMSASVVPLLSPDPLLAWMTESAPSGTPGPNSTRYPLYIPATNPTDRAASILSYRDKLDMRTRPPLTVSGDVTTPNGATIEISFRDSTATPELTPALAPRRPSHTQPHPQHPRAARLPLAGRILAVLLRDAAPANDPYRSNSMDFYGFDRVRILGHREIDANNMPYYGTSVADDEVNDEITDDYSEKIAVANAALGSITTRSDTFCVWFVLHGYQQSDVENLSPRDPLAPTLAKRFMMIVDRTNVVKKGDKPRILMFREVPL